MFLSEDIVMKKFYLAICTLILMFAFASCNDNDTTSKIKVNKNNPASQASDDTPIQEDLVIVDKDNDITVREIKPDKMSFTSEDKLEIHINISGYDTSGTAWIGIVPSTIGHGKEAVCDSYDIAYKHLKDVTNNKVVFEKISGQSGEYDIRVFDNDDGGKEVAYITGLTYERK